VVFYVIQMITLVLLALAANTSFGGLPVLASLLARDNFLPHLFALRADRRVFRYGVTVLAVAAGLLLVVARGNTQALVPLFAFGVFVGFTLSQVRRRVAGGRRDPAACRDLLADPPGICADWHAAADRQDAATARPPVMAGGRAGRRNVPADGRGHIGGLVARR
jgi:hypothetical protein